MMKIGERIRELRKKNGISQTTLANIMRNEYGLGTDRVAVSKWETGYQMPGTDAVRCIAMYFGVTADYLMGGEAHSEMCVPIYKSIYKKGENKGYAVLPHGYDGDFCIIAPDDSMSGAGILAGSFVFGKSNSYADNGELTVAVVDGTVVIRRYYSEGNTVVLVSECGRSVPSIYGKNEVNVLGRAVVVQCPLI